MEHKGAHPVIVKKRHHAHDGHHGGAWKVAYADFVTAMMAFFLVMWLVGQTDAVKASVAGYFQDPVGFSDKFADMGTDLDAKGLPGSSAVDGLLSAPPKTDARRELEETARSLRQYLGQLGAFAKLKDAIEIEVTDEGVEISLIEDQGDFFASGGKELSPAGADVLRAIGHEIAAGGFEVIVEGHTDSVPFRGKDPDYSNWELSADRANAARRVLGEGGVAPEKVRSVRGFASSKPRPYHWPEDPLNRRVTILVARHFDR